MDNVLEDLNGTTTDMGTRTDASLAKLKAQRAAQELPFGSLQSLKKRAMRPDVKESLLLPDRLFYLIDRIQTLPSGSRANLLRRFGVDPEDVEDEDELHWLQLWAVARDMDIDSEHFWSAIPREIVAVLKYGLHDEQEWKQIEAQNRKLRRELSDVYGQFNRFCFWAKLHNSVYHSGSRPEALSLPCGLWTEPMGRSESAAKPDDQLLDNALEDRICLPA